ncbi:MAG: heme exporter protein CcmD [Rhizobiales bacterium]|nr:heme exporter protein CcmD [Hyphomicrobiales bacterium]
MLDLASPHVGFVLASYVLSAAVLLGLVAWTFMKKRQLDAEARRHSAPEE